MVPVINLHEYRRSLKKAIIQRLELVSVEGHPNDFAWLVFALSRDGQDDNPLFLEAIDNLSRWVNTADAQTSNKFLPAICIALSLCKGGEKDADLVAYVRNRLATILRNDVDRFSPLNDPQVVLPITWGIKGEDFGVERHKLIEVCCRNVKSGKLFRRAIFSACLVELDYADHVDNTIYEKATAPQDILTALWLTERYNCKDASNSRMWIAFSNVIELISNDGASDIGVKTYYLSFMDLALLYEAVTHQTSQPDPIILFSMYPIHNRIREVSRSLFEKGEYTNSVFEATKVLDTVVKERSGLDKSGRSLMQEAMRVKEPMIRYNRLETQTEKDEQEGLKLISEGIMSAYRNPKGHEPKDTEWGDIDPYDALDQLISISYIMRRVEASMPPKGA